MASYCLPDERYSSITLSKSGPIMSKKVSGIFKVILVNLVVNRKKTSACVSVYYCELIQSSVICLVDFTIIENFNSSYLLYC